MSNSRGRSRRAVFHSTQPGAPSIRLVARWLNLPSRPDLETIYRWWRAIEGGAALGLPPESLFQAMRVFDAQLLLSERLDDRQDFRGTSCGALWTRVIGTDMTGKLLSRHQTPQVQQRTRLLFQRAICKREPVFFASRLVVGAHICHPEMMFLPLGTGQGEITRILSVIQRIED